MLKNRLRTLLKDHKSTLKNCKHCILRHKKSLQIMNVFLGDLDQFPDIGSTTFAGLVREGGDEYQSIEGLRITVKQTLTKRENG
mmetsp:Transcript_7153/g.6428  ORF Transcript_7153/g.6428 Transcript_7153/m.6428 type:complete len:84 (-) Transcript_7153:1706-1957(-)